MAPVRTTAAASMPSSAMASVQWATTVHGALPSLTVTPPSTATANTVTTAAVAMRSTPPRPPTPGSARRRQAATHRATRARVTIEAR